MTYQQDPSNTVAKRAHSSELTKWRDDWVNPEYLYDVQPCSEPRHQGPLPDCMPDEYKKLFTEDTCRSVLEQSVRLELPN